MNVIRLYKRNTAMQRAPIAANTIGEEERALEYMKTILRCDVSPAAV